MRLLTARTALARPGGLSPSLMTSYSTGAPAATFANQHRLPRLPVPALSDTVARYLRSVRPLLPAAEYASTERAASIFIKDGELGPELQRRLLKVDAEAPHSWLEDIWLKKAYLEWRDPSYINVNWFALLADNPDFPLTDAERGRPSHVQIRRAARLVTHMLEMNEALNQGSLPAEMQRDAPLCMNQYKWQFGTTRIPRPGCDVLVNQYPSTARHILVMYRNQTVEVPVYNADGQRANISQITSQLALATERVDKLLAAQALPS
ncbi:hypothetical protein H4S07_001960, partial [Coemansia furcata]